jgi:hypothetical protein
VVDLGAAQLVVSQSTEGSSLFRPTSEFALPYELADKNLILAGATRLAAPFRAARSEIVFQYGYFLIWQQAQNRRQTTSSNNKRSRPLYQI